MATSTASVANCARVRVAGVRPRAATKCAAFFRQNSSKGVRGFRAASGLRYNGDRQPLKPTKRNSEVTGRKDYSQNGSVQAKLCSAVATRRLQGNLLILTAGPDRSSHTGHGCLKPPADRNHCQSSRQKNCGNQGQSGGSFKKSQNQVTDPTATTAASFSASADDVALIQIKARQPGLSDTCGRDVCPTQPFVWPPQAY